MVDYIFHPDDNYKDESGAALAFLRANRVSFAIGKFRPKALADIAGPVLEERSGERRRSLFHCWLGVRGENEFEILVNTLKGRNRIVAAILQDHFRQQRLR